MHLGHAAGDDADEKIQHDHGAEHDETHKIDPGGDGRRPPGIGENITPVIQRDHLEQGEQCGGHGAEVLGIMCALSLIHI